MFNINECLPDMRLLYAVWYTMNLFVLFFEINDNDTHENHDTDCFVLSCKAL